jgi:diguanylate cyclase (GGDEF)-like protein
MPEKRTVPSTVLKLALNSNSGIPFPDKHKTTNRRRTMPMQEVQSWGPKPIGPEELPFGDRFFRKLFDNLYDGVYFVNTQRQLLFWNAGAERLTGYTAKEVLGSYCYANILDHIDGGGNHLCSGACPLVHTIDTGLPVSTRVFLRHKDGRRIAVDVNVMPLRNDLGNIIGGIEIFRDASSAVALETAYGSLRELAERDPLTGVANRRHLNRILDDQIELLTRTGIPFSVVMADIDHFKQVNDTWGHPMGDKALIGFAEKLEASCRQTDIVGRWGGEEFLVILPEQQLTIAATAAERMRAATAASAPEELRARGLAGSFGVTEAILGDTAIGVIERADVALYRAKSLGRNRVETNRAAASTP